MNPTEIQTIHNRVLKDRKAIESIKGSSITPDPKWLQAIADTEALLKEVERVSAAAGLYREKVHEGVRAILEANDR